MSYANILITGETEGVEAMLVALDTALSIQGMGTFFRETVDPYLRRRASARFASEGDSAVGGPWAELRPATVAIREGQGLPGEHPINRRTGELERYITETEGDVFGQGSYFILQLPGSTDNAELIHKLSVAQQGGFTPDHRPVVARPVLGLDQQDLQFVTAELEVFLVKYATGVIS